MKAWYLFSKGFPDAFFWLFLPLSLTFFVLGWWAKKTVHKKSVQEKCWALCDRSGNILDASLDFWRFWGVQGKTVMPMSLFALLEKHKNKYVLEDMRRTWEKQRIGITHYVLQDDAHNVLMCVHKAKHTHHILVTLSHACMLSAEQKRTSHFVEQQRKPIDFLPTLLARYEDHGHLTYMNKAWLDTMQRVKHKTEKIFFSLEILNTLVKRAERTGQPASDDQISVLGKNGEKLFFHVTVVAENSHDGWIYGVERTNYVGMQKVLLAQTKIFDHVMRKIPLGVCIFDAQQSLKSVNSVFAVLFSLEDFFKDTGRILVEDMLHMLRDKRMLPEVLNFQAYLKQVQNFLTAPDQMPHEEIWCLPNERMVRLVLSGHPGGGVVFFLEDMTEKLQIVRKKKEMNALTEVMTAHIQQGVIVLSSSMRLQFINPYFSSLWGLGSAYLHAQKITANNLLNLCCQKLRHKKSTSFYEKFFQHLFGERRGCKLFFFMADGKLCCLTYVPLHTGEHVLFFADQTAVHISREHALESERMFQVERYLECVVGGGAMHPMTKSAPQKDNSDQAKHIGGKQSASMGDAPVVRLSQQSRTRPLYHGKEVLNWNHRESFFIGDIIDNVLILFDAWMQKKDLTVQVLGVCDKRVRMSRIACCFLLERFIGYGLHELVRGARLILSVRSVNGSLFLAMSGRVSSLETGMAYGMSVLDKQTPVRSWHLSVSALDALAKKAGCCVRVFSYRADFLGLGCWFPLAMVEKTELLKKSASHLLSVPQFGKAS